MERTVEQSWQSNRVTVEQSGVERSGGLGEDTCNWDWSTAKSVRGK